MKFNNFLNNKIALERQIEDVVSSFGHIIRGHNYFNFRCQICGDSKKSKLKKRGYILTSKNPWIYFCHNCFYKKPVIIWLKEYHPQNYRAYIEECIRLNKNDEKVFVVKNPGLKPRKEVIEVHTDKIINPEREHTKFFIPILNKNSLQFTKAQQICQSRRIPEDVWTKWFVAIDGMYKNRLIIPFFDNKGKIYFYQGRALNDYMIPKYLSRSGDHNSIYNYYNVDKSKFVNVTEGPIDSIFVENSIAMTGLKEDDHRLNDFLFKRFILDNDNAGKEKSIKLMDLGYSVFLWELFIKKYGLSNNIKDINDAVINLNMNRLFKSEELNPFFSKNTFDKIYIV
jgi:hypothetical protein